MTIQHQPMKVTFICHSDTVGGASLVTYRLMNALRSEGVDARMVVFVKTSNNPNVTAIGSRYTRGLKFVAERLSILAKNGLSRSNLFKVSEANTGFDLAQHPWVREADVIALSWINQGMLSLSDIKGLGELGKPIVWTMHDMWCLTGICHHALSCDNYTRQCGKCHFLRYGYATDLSNKVWRRKKALYDQVPITFVAVSNWLAECAKQSSLLSNRDVRVIPNAFPINSFTPFPTAPLNIAEINPSKKLIVMGAARLDDPIKGIEYAIDALNLIFDNNPEVARTSTAVFFGDIRDKSLFDRLRFSHLHLGRINDPAMLSSLYASAKVVLSTSLYETLPGTLIEGQASGCLPVTFGMGGQRDIVTHLRDGYIAEYKDPQSVAAGIEWALNAEVDRQTLHESVRQRFAASAIAQRYISLFTSLLAR